MIAGEGMAIAVFLDRDGTINEEVSYLSRIEDLRLLPDVAQAIRLLNDRGFKIVVITNQSGIARGFFTEGFVDEVHDTMSAILSKEGARIDRFYYCPHHPTEGTGRYLKACRCRKPEPGMLLQAAQEFAIDLGRSYVVGDMPKDLEVARRVGAKGILVRTGYGAEQPATLSPAELGAAYVADNLLAAARWIIADLDRSSPETGVPKTTVKPKP